jgi:aminomethyltransferase
MQGRAVPRQDYPVLVEGRIIGKITSGTQSPTLGAGIAMALVESGLVNGQACDVSIRGRLEPAQVVSRRFYRR